MTKNQLIEMQKALNEQDPFCEPKCYIEIESFEDDEDNVDATAILRAFPNDKKNREYIAGERLYFFTLQDALDVLKFAKKELYGSLDVYEECNLDHSEYNLYLGYARASVIILPQ